MTHQLIQILDLSLVWSHKTCFEGFTARVAAGNRIAIMGRNGCGKSSLLRILQGELEASGGRVIIAAGLSLAYLPQIIDATPILSGGQRFNAALSKAISQNPQLLLLDEPTNHLDRTNRNSLLRMLSHYRGTLIVVSHDTELLRHCVHTFWHIDEGRVNIFTGQYDDYQQERALQRMVVERDLSRLQHEKKDTHRALMQEQRRAAKSKNKGRKSIDQRKWPTIVCKAKALRAGLTAGRKQAAIADKKQALQEALHQLRLPNVISPRFSLQAADIGDKVVLWVQEGSVGYDRVILTRINLTLRSTSRLALVGDNASGKSTFLRACLGQADVILGGDWQRPKGSEIGYLDQHYANLTPDKNALELMTDCVPAWSDREVRQHLMDFLFCKNEEVTLPVARLSGGERVRLSLALMAAKTPRLLLLDEITNNLDLETKTHVIEVLQHYPGAMMIISHDQDFLQAIGITDWLEAKAGCLTVMY